MGIFSGLLLASDMDGTLLGHAGHILPCDLAAIRHFIAEGGTFTLCTGRTRLSMEVLIDHVPLNAPALLANGGMMFDYATQKILFEQSLEDNYLEACAAVAAHFPTAAVEVHGDTDLWVYHANEITDSHFALIQREGILIDDLQTPPQPWLKAVFTAHPPVPEQIRAFLNERYPDCFSLVSAYDSFLEVLHVDANKGAGVARLAKYMGIPHENVFCIGDNNNDIPMLSRFKSFAPASGTAEARGTATHTVADCDSGAVAAAIALIQEVYCGA